MLKITFKNLWARKLRLVTTGLAIFIGVSFMAGTMVLTDTVTATFNDLFASVNAGTDVQVQRKALVEGDDMGVRGRTDEALVAEVARVDGVEFAAGFVQGFTQITGSDGEALGNPGRGAPTFGMSWYDDPATNPFTIVDGRAPRADNEIVIDRASAAKGKLAVGDLVELDAARPVPAMKLVGVARFGNADSPAGASVVLFTPAAAQAYVGEPGKVDAIIVRGEDGISQETLRSRVAQVIPADTEARTGAEVTEEAQAGVREMLSFFSTFMLTFALIALFVGSFIIYNTFSILVAQRTREVALLRAVGASTKQVVGAVLLESLVVGAIASVLGIVAGIGVAGLLKGLLKAVGFEIPAGGIVLTTGTVVASLITGMVVTTVAAVLPARRAARVAPVAALSGAAVDSGDEHGRGFVVGTALTLVGAAIGAYGLFLASSSEALFVGLGGVVMFVGIAALGPVVARPVASFIGAPLPAARGMAGTLARENAMRNPRRTSSTAAALLIGVALVAFITIFATSAKANINDTIGEQFAGDVIVQSGSFGFGGLEPSISERIASLPGVEAVSGVRYSPANLDGEGVGLMAVEPVDFAKIVNVELIAGAFDGLGTDGLAVNESVASEKGWVVGDVVPMSFAESGQKTFVVRAIYEDGQLLNDYMISTEAQELNFTSHFDGEIYVKKAPDVALADLKTAIEGVVVDQSNAEVVDRDGYIEAQAADINQMLGLIYVLLALAVIIAVLGIANTLALSIHERTRELGVLRAVGMTRQQLRTAVRWESVIIALFGAAGGVAVGVGFGWAMVLSVADEGFEALVIPYGQLLVIALLAALCGVVAAIRPARRAARLDVLTAIATT